MGNTLVSIIVPVYNAEEYLGRCLDSIINQTYQDIEIVLVDDGSTDNSGEICEDYALKDSRIVVAHIPNGGASMARKKGLELCKGQYVTFVDSDDWVSPYYISTLLQLIDEYGVNVSSCGVQRVKQGDVFGREIVETYNTQLLPFDKLMPRFFKYEFWGFVGKIYLRSCFDHLFFPVATLSEDYYVMTQLFYKEQQFAVSDAPLYYYEYHENSLSHQKLSIRAFEEFDNVKAVYDYVCTNMPQYRDYAFSNVVETAVKLNFFRDQDIEQRYKKQFTIIDIFLKKSCREILSNNRIPKGVKLLALGMSLNPSISILCFRLLNGKA